MSNLTILDAIRIASPCPANWDEMTGDDRSRFCSSCSKQVYNIAAMTAEEATTLILDREGQLCMRIYRRSDGTVITADCPVGAKSRPRRRLHKILAVGLVVPALLLARMHATGLVCGASGPCPSGEGVTWDDCVDWAMVTLGLRTPPPPPTPWTPPPGGRVTMGAEAF